MKRDCILKILTFIFTINFCYAQGQWVWMHGDNTFLPFANSSFGTKGVSSPSNKPGARYENAEWIDQQGNFWLYGGLFAPGSGYGVHSDLWKYNPVTNEWTWMHGDSVPGGTGVYGMQGIPSPSNVPDSRGFGELSWTDNNGKLWLFGGSLSTGSLGTDLWKFDVTTNEWTWMKGDPLSSSGTYGIKGISDPNNIPKARSETSCSWVDNNGYLWLLGGSGIEQTQFGSVIEYYNDLWMYNPNTNEWTWVNGDSLPNQKGVYGVKGFASSTNKPGARNVYASWKDNNGDFWMFGGNGFDADGTQGDLNDLWKYNITSNQWTWVSGSDSVNQVGDYGLQCVEVNTNIPSARFETRSRWIDDCDNLWLFGGGYYSSASSINDLWKYNPVSNQWTWIGGDTIPNQYGVYGTKGVPSALNKPGATQGSNAWRNKQGLYLYGITYGGGNDLWKYIPDTPYVGFTYNDSLVCADLAIIKYTNTSTASCSGEIKAYAWDFGDPSSGADNISSLQSPVHQYNSSGIYNVKLKITTCLGIEDSAITAVNINLKSLASLGNDTSACIGDTVTLDAGSSGGNYLWSTGDTTQTINVASGGIYWLEVSKDFCTDRDSININFLPYPTVFLGNDTTLCPDANLTLDAGNSGSTYQWSTGEITQSIVVVDSNFYWVEVFSAACSESDTILISKLKQIDLGEDISLCDVFPNTLIMDAGYNAQAGYLWSTGETTSSIEVTEPGTVWVEKQISNCILVDTIEVTGNLGSSGLYLPNTFTPNSDGLNEVFTAYGEEVTYFQMQIFNRWGELIYQTQDFNKGWDGKHKNGLIPNGIYLWTVDYQSGCTGDEILHKIGYVLLNN